MRLGIISNSVWPGWLIEADLEREGIRELFECVVVSSDVGQRKPGPKIFEKALEELGLAAGDCVFVGDSIQTDVVGARQVQMRAILVERAPEPGPEPDARIRSLSELEAALAEM